MTTDEVGITPLTREQAVILTACTGTLLLEPIIFMSELEKKLGRKIQPAEWSNPDFQEFIRETYREDFLKLVYRGEIITLS